MKLLAIDPSVHGTGFAFFHGGQLKNTALWDTKIVARRSMFGEIARRAYQMAENNASPMDTIVCEIPQIYKTSPGDPNDLVAVAMVAGALCAAIPCKKIETFWPAEWKGQVPKAIHHKRLMGKLSAAELTIVKEAKITAGERVHNILDAVGLGVWHLARAGLR